MSCVGEARVSRRTAAGAGEGASLADAAPPDAVPGHSTPSDPHAKASGCLHSPEKTRAGR